MVDFKAPAFPEGQVRHDHSRATTRSRTGPAQEERFCLQAHSKQTRPLAVQRIGPWCIDASEVMLRNRNRRIFLLRARSHATLKAANDTGAVMEARSG